MEETIVRVPVAGAAVFDEPSFVQGGAISDVGVVENGEVVNKGEVVDAVCRVNSGRDENGWEGEAWI